MDEGMTVVQCAGEILDLPKMSLTISQILWFLVPTSVTFLSRSFL